MPSRTIRPTQAPEPAPFTYTVGTAEGLAPQAVTAQWDGTGAGGDFLPCVSFYNAEGVLLDRAFPTTGAVTAGDTAEVSYRPFDRGGGGGGTSTALTVEDAITAVSPVNTEFVFDPLVVSNLGGGIAGIAYAPAYALCSRSFLGGTVFTGNQKVPFTVNSSQGFTHGTDTLTVGTDGFYEISVMMEYGIVGASVIGQTYGWFFVDSVPGNNFGSIFGPAPVVPAGQTLITTTAITKTRHLTAGSVLDVIVSTNPGGLNQTVFALLFDVVRRF